MRFKSNAQRKAVMCKWKKSQVSSGFYKKQQGKIPEFIRFERNEDRLGKTKYDVLYKKGIGDKKTKLLFTTDKKRFAVLFAKRYMKKC